jgi:surfactin synthase thioesterase subunit
MTGTMRRKSARDWYVPLADDGPTRLFAFPHAGAGSARMVRLAKAVAPDVAVWSANLPGRQARLAEPPFTDLDALVDELAGRLATLARPPYALFGYCAGALLAFLVARALRDHGAPQPTALVVVSYEAPDIAYRPRRLANLPSALLWSKLAGQGAPADDLTGQEHLRSVAEPAIRADFAMLGGYRYTVAPPLSCPVVVCFGTEDPTPRGAFLGWRRQSIHAPRLRALPGGHWLLDEAGGPLAETVVRSVTGGPR